MTPSDPVGMSIGDVITIVPHDPRWPGEFERVRSELERALGNRILAIHHVGSTSVPRLDAKPIIDILVGVPDLAASLRLIPVLESHGFRYRPEDELPDRHYFPRSIGGIRLHHVSLAEPSSRHYRNTLTFRDALRRDPALTGQYAALKGRLATAAGAERLLYLNGKTEFILGVLASEGAETGGDYPTTFGAH